MMVGPPVSHKDAGVSVRLKKCSADFRRAALPADRIETGGPFARVPRTSLLANECRAVGRGRRADTDDAADGNVPNRT